jgi:hypothetical protein
LKYKNKREDYPKNITIKVVILRGKPTWSPVKGDLQNTETSMFAKSRQLLKGKSV